jgi:tetratricopeptide (TPR) repeat protein
MISPTNLPSGNALRDICVTELLTDRISKPYIAQLLAVKPYQALLPEAVLQDLASTLGSCVDELLVTLLRQARPNQVHKYLAKNYARLFTTNFDLCLEDSSAQFVGHLHGTIAQPQSLQNRMYRLGKTALPEMQEFRSRIQNKPLLVLGYSFRDSDLVDAIERHSPSLILYLSRSGTLPPTQGLMTAPVYWANGSAEDLLGLSIPRTKSRRPAVNHFPKPSMQKRANALERLCFRAAQYDLQVAVVRAYLSSLRGRSRVQALCGMANTLRVSGRFDDSVQVCHRVINSRAANHPSNADVLSTAYVVLALCDLDRRKTNYSEIETSFLEGLRIFEELIRREKNNRHLVENDIWRARIFNNLGLLYEAKGQHRKAIQYYLRSCKLKRKHFEEYGLAQTTSNLAKTYVATNKMALALGCLQEVLAWMQKIPDSYICEDAIFEVLHALQSKALVKIKPEVAALAADYSSSWWRAQIRKSQKSQPHVSAILRTLNELRIILSRIRS